MKITKETLIISFALFAMFFGAGNLILPPFLGFFAGSNWYFVAIGFAVSAVGLPLLGILAHAKLQGNIFNFAEKVSPVFSLVFCLVIYAISVALPAPRTAAVTHEIAIEPFFGSSAFMTSLVYFFLVFVFVIKRSVVIDNMGKFLTPAIILVLLAIILSGFFSEYQPMAETSFERPFLDGFFEGYQTYDAIAALVVGGVIINSVKIKGYKSHLEIKKIITTAAIFAGLGLFFTYAGLIYNGAMVNSELPGDITRTQLLSDISFLNLGIFAKIGLAILVSLACFTTAVGIITGTADFLSQTVKKKYVYEITVVCACCLGIVMGTFSVNDIIEIGLPVLLLIYPLTIVLILLNILPDSISTPLVKKATVLVTVIFSLPDALKYIISAEDFFKIQNFIPLSALGLAWVIPAVVTFALVFLFSKKINKD